MSKRNRIIYWVSTCWLALGMMSTGGVQIMRVDEEVSNFQALGYPTYLMTILGVWKILGSIAVLVPRFPLVKEWAYAGFVFAMSGAAFSRVAIGGSVNEMVPSLLLLALSVISWYFRPADRRLVSTI